MPETHEEALARAKKEGFPASAVVQSDKGNWFIAPHGIESAAAKKAYANCREGSENKGMCAAVAHMVEDRAKRG